MDTEDRKENEHLIDFSIQLGAIPCFVYLVKYQRHLSAIKGQALQWKILNYRSCLRSHKAL